MGNITSRPEDGSSLYLKDQTRFSIGSVTISNGRRKVVLNLAPNAFPAARLLARRELGDERPVAYIQDPDTQLPSFLLKIEEEDELDFHFSFVTRQSQSQLISTSTSNAPATPADTSISGLTFAYAPSTRELDTLVTREFHVDPNLHKNSNVQLIGDFATGGSPATHYDWTWRWRPPKPIQDRGGGWRNSCSFLEYDSRAHRLNTLGSFTFWVNSKTRTLLTPLASPSLELTVPMIRHRMPSAQSYQSTVSDSEGPDFTGPPSPSISAIDINVSASQAPPVRDVSCQRPGDDYSAVEDGPLFRATMKSLEQKTGNMRVQIKKVLKKAEAAQQSQVECNIAMRGFLGALQEAANSNNSSAFKPALDHYFNKIATRILQYETDIGVHLQKEIIEPFSKLYQLDIKQAEAKKKDFEDESRDYYAYVSRYLGQRQDSLKEKKRVESDSKYQSKKRNFELKRFDYSTFMQDLHGGRKEQELLSQLTKYADGQAKSFLNTAKKVESLTPQLDALIREVANTDKEYKVQRTEREEKRRNLEMNTSSQSEADSQPPIPSNPSSAQSNGAAAGYISDTELNRADSTASTLGYASSAATLSPSNSLTNPHTTATFSSSPGNTSTTPQSRFRGIRDLEERDASGVATDSPGGLVRKEGLLWALRSQNLHIDPKGINKQAWHKFWIVLDQGKLAEYSNWKDRLDPHGEPIDLRMASVRPARDADRRFCFEVITPLQKSPRVYQATSEDDMKAWIKAINNALQSAVEGRGNQVTPQAAKTDREPGGRDIGSVLTGKSSSQSGPHGYHQNRASDVNRSTTVGARPSYIRTNSNSYEDNPSKLLDQIRTADAGNAYCADCGSSSRVEWVSLNLGIILCIDCSGIHRSLGTHVTKIRSLTLDLSSFTTDLVEMLLLIGNRVSNMVWEATLNRDQKPNPQFPRDAQLKFIIQKYVDRAFVDHATNVPAGGPDEMLLTCIKKNEIKGVLHAIALRANTNIHDRSRGTHAVFLALAAADPAAPGTSPAVSPNARETAQRANGDGRPIKAFPVAEMLVQNGAEIPATLPLIPLSPASQLYMEQRTARRQPDARTSAYTGAPARSDSVNGSAAGNHHQNGDILGPLPTRGFSERDKDRYGHDREARLQKRGSAGARFAGKVAEAVERGLGG